MGPYPLVGMDEPEHRRLRSLVAQAFRQRMLAHWDEDLVVPVVDGMIDRFVDRGAAELVNEFTYRYPVQVIARDPRPLARRPRVLPPARARGDQRRGATRRGDRRERRAARVLRRRASTSGARNPGNDLISELVPGRARRRAARRRGDLLVPAPAAPGRRRDHVPRDRQLHLRAAHPSRPVRGAAGRPLAHAAGDRGVDPVGEPAAHHVARVLARHRARRRRDPEGRDGHHERRLGEPRPDPVGPTATSSTSSASRSRTSRSASACTCASGCTSPAWRWRAR